MSNSSLSAAARRRYRLKRVRRVVHFGAKRIARAFFSQAMAIGTNVFLEAALVLLVLQVASLSDATERTIKLRQNTELSASAKTEANQTTRPTVLATQTQKQDACMNAETTFPTIFEINEFKRRSTRTYVRALLEATAHNGRAVFAMTNACVEKTKSEK